MLSTLLIIVGIVAALFCAVLKKAYMQMGKGQKNTPNMPPANQRALHYIASRKIATAVLFDTTVFFLLSVVTVLLAIKIGLLAIAAIFILFVLLLLLIPELRNSKILLKFAYFVAPSVRTCLEQLKPLSKKTGWLKKHRKQQLDSGIYTRNDLLEFIKRQKQADNNLISNEELDTLVARIEFEDKKARDIMEHKTKAKIVGASEQIGPVLIDELHKTGRQFFLVKEEFINEVIGTLNMDELLDLKKTGDVKSAMAHKLFYLNEKNTLTECLDGWRKTGSAVFVVVNSDEDIVGILSINDVIDELINTKSSSDFDLYDSLEAVAEGRYETQDS